MSRLDQTTSPYLQLHKDNPVQWYLWGREAFEAAAAQNKPILLSVGYTACHWCHVMNRESFEDAQTAALMNDNFINVLVDRTERPDVDQVYQNAATLMGARGGWPLTMFLDSKGMPYLAGGYFAKEEKAGGLPSFKTALTEAAKLYRDRADEVAQGTARIGEQLNEVFNRSMRAPLDAQALDLAAISMAHRFDIFFGGIIGTPKFPSVQQVEVLWRAYLRSAAPQFLQLMSTTLDHMLIAGLYDHVGGGFFRYVVDERWETPHFEKVGNDNAQIVGLMTSVWQHNRNAICEIRIHETIDWLMREMMVEDAFAAALDADTDGEEGKYYLWSEAEIDAALVGTFVQKFKQAYSVTRDGNFNGKNVLHRQGSSAPFPQSDADETLLKRQRDLLLAARQKRNAPLRDDKVLADANGMMITALVEAGQAMGRTDWTTAAIKAFDFVVKALGDGDKLSHSWRAGKRGHQAFSDDYAHMARAALALWEATGEPRFLERAKAWAHTLNENYWDGVMGGYFYTAHDDEPLIVRTRSIYDQTQPPANAVMIGVLARLFMATNEMVYNERCGTLLRGFTTEAMRVPQAMGSYFNNVEFAASNLQIVIVGPNSSAKTQELVAAVNGRSLPNKLLTVVTPDFALPEGHVARGKAMENGQPTAYLCQRGSVSAPITNAVTLSQILQLPQQRPAPGARPQ
ncbi:MAG: thioredoxin domain-containing protein [Alphaproteobacteria bacterium]|nr:thioredoxin domain-containing protein [Alphaproteobacteria bacterium]